MALRPTPALPPLKSCDCSLLFQDTISLGHLPWHLICFWWPCRDVAIHMGNWISLWPTQTKLLSFFLLYFPSLFLSPSLSLTNTQLQPVQLAEKDCFDWAIHVCWLKRLLRWLVILMDLLFSWENILISVSEIRQMTWRLIFITPLQLCWFMHFIFVAFLVGTPPSSCSTCSNLSENVLHYYLDTT